MLDDFEFLETVHNERKCLMFLIPVTVSRSFVIFFANAEK
jgi:hypothetical protein